MLRLGRLAELGRAGMAGGQARAALREQAARKQAAPAPALARFISTSKKNSDTATPTILDEAKTKEEEVPKFLDPKTHVSYGFSTDAKEDTFLMHAIFFASVSLCLVMGGSFWAYVPDPALIHWASREGYLQLRYREENGLPLIDPNYVDPANISLPSDEELADTDIII